MTIARSHDRERLDVARRRDVSLPAPADRTPAARRARPYRPTIGALLEPYRAALAGAQGAEAADLARRTLAIFRGAQRELGATGAARGPSVLAHLLGYALQHAISQQLGITAAQAGLGSARGLALLGESQRAQGRSERSWVAAIAACGLLRGRAPDPGTKPTLSAPRAALEARAAEILAESEREGTE